MPIFEVQNKIGNKYLWVDSYLLRRKKTFRMKGFDACINLPWGCRLFVDDDMKRIQKEKPLVCYFSTMKTMNLIQPRIL